MRFSTVQIVAATLAYATGSAGLNILLGNDDGFAASNLREANRLLKQAGHKTVVVAPAENQSGMGGRTVFDSSATLQRPAQYGIIPAGAPSLGRDPNDPDVFYYNGTPAACTFVALDYVLPKYYPNFKLDLFISGPNFGNNLGPFVFTLSGTVGSTYAAVGRNVPGIAVSGGNTAAYSYLNLTKPTASGLADPATLQGRLVVKLVNRIANATKPGQRIFPLGYGLSVNTPFLTSLTNKSCINPPFIQSRLTGGAFSDSAVFSNGVFTYANNLADGVNANINGNFDLPGETELIAAGCYSGVSVFTIDYDAPIGRAQTNIRTQILYPLVTYNNSLGGKTQQERRSNVLTYAKVAPRHA